VAIEEGKAAPQFTLTDAKGKKVALRDLKGKNVIVYFYPKDDTPGCTIQACDFRDSLPRFEGIEALVLGISPDPVEAHAGFRAKFGLNFPLLADEDHTVSEAYGVWKERMSYGRRIMGIERSTFLIDADGNVAEVWRKVRPEGHTEMLAEFLGA